jgi:uncharacterized protein YjbJ (UPF0337 family)
MNKDELKGKGENLKGRVKEAYGSLSGDKGKQAEGLIERMRGAVREKFGKGKEEVSRSTPVEPEEDLDEDEGK